MRVAICTRDPGGIVAHRVAERLRSRRHIVEVVTSGEAVLNEQLDLTFNVGLWRRDSRTTAAAANARQAAMILEATGVPFVNSLASCARAHNKLVSQVLFRRAGVHTPTTWALTYRREELPVVPNRPLIAKPVYGQRAGAVKLVRDVFDAYGHQETIGRPVIVQEYIEWESFLRVVATPDATIRAYHQPRDPMRLPLIRFDAGQATRLAGVRPEIRRTAQQMVAAVGGGLMGADLLVGPRGKLYALEVNSSFGFDVDDDTVVGAFVNVMEARAK